MSVRGRWARIVSRDTVFLGAGLAILGKQAGIGFPPPQEVSALLVGAGLILVNAPGIAQLLPALLGREGSTPASPSPPESGPPPPSSGSPSGAPSPVGET